MSRTLSAYSDCGCSAYCGQRRLTAVAPRSAEGAEPFVPVWPSTQSANSPPVETGPAPFVGQLSFETTAPQSEIVEGLWPPNVTGGASGFLRCGCSRSICWFLNWRWMVAELRQSFSLQNVENPLWMGIFKQRFRRRGHLKSTPEESATSGELRGIQWLGSSCLFLPRSAAHWQFLSSPFSLQIVGARPARVCREHLPPADLPRPAARVQAAPDPAVQVPARVQAVPARREASRAGRGLPGRTALRSFSMLGKRPTAVPFQPESTSRMERWPAFRIRRSRPESIP